MKKQLLFACLLSFFVILTSSQSFATIYYVATTGNDNNIGTSLFEPFATLSKAVSKATVAGDIIYVRSGTYTVSTPIKISKPGTAANRILLSVYPPDMANANSRPVFDFSGMAFGSSNRGIVLGANYWNIYGIIIKGAGDNGMNVDNGSYCKIEFCTFTRNRDAGLQLGGGSSRDSIINCDSYENADFNTATGNDGGNADGFAAKLDIGDSIVFKGCRSWYNSDDGYDGYLRPSNNVFWSFEDCWAFHNGYYWLDGSTNGDQNGMGFKTGGSDGKNLAHNTVLAKCISFNNKARGFDQNNNAGSIYVYNCTAYSNGDNDFGFNNSGVTYVSGAQLVLKNNLSLGKKGVNLPSASTGSRTLVNSNNSFSTSTTSAEILSFDTTGVTAMRNVDGSLPTLTFMHLNTSASTPFKYIDQGTVLSTVTYHGSAGIPYIGAAPDLGAFESNYTTPVPVKMTSFTAYTNGKYVKLNWNVSTEVNNKGWTIERSATSAAASWTTIGFVDGKGNSSIANSYSFEDNDNLAGTYYYRLKQTDLDGNVIYSSILAVNINAANVIAVAGFPNPFNSSATIRYSLPVKAKVVLSIFNQQGQLINKLVEETQQAGTYQKLINGQRLASGQYYLQLNVDGKTISNTLIKE
ncbi:right-handed parallel beta-helix repeat-containing protein [Ferruginibacter albus]|uniref:right-handed parallel beta-helix repeat-containing protein n=1 Tax=Ferruginibacter albus TaxID=2875540 RepID=UPI001CC6A347|nr:T9SS type A sorting domain-containing protein [Ferruginibacter albus]UAY50922.1 T9SS type A sorting domain-containing protein [Ferruginibacter albus]